MDTKVYFKDGDKYYPADQITQELANGMTIKNLQYICQTLNNTLMWFKRKQLPLLHKQYMELKTKSVKEYQKELNTPDPQLISNHHNYMDAKFTLEMRRFKAYVDYMNAIETYHKSRRDLHHRNEALKYWSKHNENNS